MGEIEAEYNTREIEVEKSLKITKLAEEFSYSPYLTVILSYLVMDIGGTVYLIWIFNSRFFHFGTIAFFHKNLSGIVYLCSIFILFIIGKL